MRTVARKLSTVIFNYRPKHCFFTLAIQCRLFYCIHQQIISPTANKRNKGTAWKENQRCSGTKGPEMGATEQTRCGSEYLGFMLAVGGKMFQVPATVCLLNTQQGQSFEPECSQQSSLVLVRHSLIHLPYCCLDWRQEKTTHTSIRDKEFHLGVKSKLHICELSIFQSSQMACVHMHQLCMHIFFLPCKKTFILDKKNAYC